MLNETSSLNNLNKIDKSVFKSRRDKICNHVGAQGVFIINGSREDFHEVIRYPSRQKSDFYYITGLAELDAVAVLVPKRADGEFVIFCKQTDLKKEAFEGKMVGLEGACCDYGADQAFPIERLDEMMPEFFADRRQIYSDFGCAVDFDVKIINWINIIKGKVREGIHAPYELIDAAKILHEMRVYKDNTEIALLKKSASIAVAAHLRAMQACRPGMFEYEIEAELLYEFIRHGGSSPSFKPIIGGGANSCVLHYTANNKRLNNGDVVVVDSGVEYEYYASDMTRTYPVNGKFTPEQKAIYQIVLDAQTEVISMLKLNSGATWMDAQETSERVITAGLLELGLLKGTMDELLEKKAFRAFYPHRFGHWIGLDCHDVGEYNIHGNWRALTPNILLTVEPGIYIPYGHPLVDQKWWSIGVRIEDELLLTENGCEIITKGMPKTIEEIETLMRT